MTLSGDWSMPALGSAVACATAACLLTAAPEPPAEHAASQAHTIAELWVSPPRDRDLFYGVGGRRLAPDPQQLFRVVEIKASGYSDGYGLVGPDQREWSAKFPPEASTEVIASRIFWGIGYHQPPIYYVAAWNADGADRSNPQKPARFREKHPRFHGLDDTGSWGYDDNPFVGSRPLQGLLVLQAMLGNSDLKAEQNVVYELDARFEGARRWYVARDLGQTFGRTGTFDAPRGDIEVFEETPFIRAVRDGRVELEYDGRHADLFANIAVEDVHWICQRLARLTDRQWRDAFRAGGYDNALAQRFIRRLKQKIADGLHLPVRTPSARRAS